MSRPLAVLLVLALAASAQIPRTATVKKTPEPPPAPEISKDDASRIEGEVLSLDGKPLENATVRITPTRVASMPSRTTTTDARGKFIFDLVVPANYNVSASHPGYLETMFLVPTDAPHGPRDIVQVSANGRETVRANFRLQPETVISGYVRDEDGNPVAASQIIVMRKIRSADRAELRLLSVPPAGTTAQGAFIVHGLPPGRYYLKAVVPPALKQNGEVQYVATFYPSADQTSAALPVELPANRDTLGITITLRKTQLFHIRGKVLDVSREPTNAELALIPLDTPDVSKTSTTRVSNGVFQFDNVPPGRYLVQAYPITTSQQPRQWIGQETVTVTKHLDDMVLRLEPAARLSGTVMKADLEGKPYPAGLSNTQRITLQAVGRPEIGSLSSTADTEGRFAIGGVPPGLYRIGVGGSHYLKSASVDGADATTGTFQLTSGANATAAIVLSEHGGEIRGSIQGRSKNPAINTQVSVWAPGRASDGSADIFRTTTTSNDGTFWIPNLPPGRYSVLAWEYVEPGIDGIREFRSKFTSNETTVEIREGARIAFDPPLISRERSDQEAAKLP